MSEQRRQFLKTAGSVAGLGALPAPMALAAAGATYKNPSAPVAARVKDLLSRMTLQEKVAQMQCTWIGKVKIEEPNGDFSADKASLEFPDGLGMLGCPADRRGDSAGIKDDGYPDVNRDPAQSAAYANAVQKWAVERTRLGIPLFLHEEGLHGHRAREGTSFPQAIGLASSFDPELVQQVFSVVAHEMRARGANMVLAPVVDVAREPRWGRIEETYGEDPHVCAEIGKAAVLGFQGPPRAAALPRNKVYATLKHMTGHGQPESGTNMGPAEVTERTLREEFLPPFERIIKEADVAGVMPSYNEIGGVPSHANGWLLRKVLREEWGFKGLTVSDYSGLEEMVGHHLLAEDPKQAALFAIKAGVDIETADVYAYKFLPELVKEGAVKMQEIDTVVARILEKKFRAGLFEQPYVNAAQAGAQVATPEAVALARRAATRTAVLLKNDKGVLPLQPKKVGKVLLLGTHALDTPLGGYSEVPRHVVSVHEALKAESEREGFGFRYCEGVRITEGHKWTKDMVYFTSAEVNAKLREEALAAAREADTIVMVLGDNEQTAREAWSDGHLGDRQSLDLMGHQNELAKAIFDLGKPTVVLLLNGRPLSVNLLAERADALIEGWYMGQETGNAAVDLLFGRANPGGKLPVSIARHVGQLPIFYNRKPTARRGYIDGVTTPLYPFGYGLSYTTFAFSAPRLAAATIPKNGATRVSVDVTNTGQRAGDEVVQLYLRDDISSVTRPMLELKAFRRITLAPGETKTVTLDIGTEQLQFYNIDMRRVVEPGSFTVSVGPDSVRLQSAKLLVSK